MSVGAVNKQTGERIPTAGMPAVDSVLSGTSTNPVQNRVVKAALDEKADTDMVAADFNAGTSYTAGNYCVQDGKLYKFKNNHSGAWSAADVDEVKITGELSSLKSGLTNLLKYVDITVTDTITLTANIASYRDYPKTGIPDGAALIGVRLLSTTGDALDGNVGAYLGALNFIHLLSTINKSFTSITFRIYFYGGS